MWKANTFINLWWKKNRGCAYCLATQRFSLYCNSRIRNRIINHRSTQYSLGKMSRPKYLVGVLYSDYRELVFCSLPLCLLVFSLSLLPHSSPRPLALRCTRWSNWGSPCPDLKEAGKRVSLSLPDYPALQHKVLRSLILCRDLSPFLLGLTSK